MGDTPESPSTVNSYMRSKIDSAEWAACLGRLRDGRALLLRDAESFGDAAAAIEQVGQVLGGKMLNGLSFYKDVLLELVFKGAPPVNSEFERLFKIVRDARNMAIHEGAWARHLSDRLVELFLILEEAIMNVMTTVEDVMVRSPASAEVWHFVSHIRRAMLLNSFSSMPLFFDNKWVIIEDVSIMRYLRKACTHKEKNELLSAAIGKVVESKEVVVVDAVCCKPDDDIARLCSVMGRGPVLVVQEFDKTQRLVGLVTPFDLL